MKTRSRDGSDSSSDAQPKKQKKETDLKYENEYSRLLATLGRAALKRLQQSKILLSGLGGLGIEIAKNIVLMGVSSLTLHDPTDVTTNDLSSQFFLTEDDIGKNKASASLHKLVELNERVKIVVNYEPLTEELLKNFTVVVLTQNSSSSELLRVNDICHRHKIAFLAGDVRGLFGWTFVDFGSFECIDPDGELPKTAFIAGVTQDPEGIVSVVDTKRHDFVTGEIVRITEVKGMTQLNGEFKVTDKGTYQIAIGDTTNFSPYVKGGFIEQVKTPLVFEFKPLSEFFGKTIPPDCIALGDFSKFTRTQSYGYYLQGLLAFQQKFQKLPTPGSESDAQIVFTLAQDIATSSSGSPLDVPTTQSWMTALAKGSAGLLSPMATIFGGVMGQEIIKACSSKYTPIHQFLFFDALECLPTITASSANLLTEDDCRPRGTRYDAQIAVFGEEYNRKLLDLNYFLIGAGAIGCEMLKCWAMMGVGCGEKGHVDVTDMDTIEISNLNRQFLYRQQDVNEFKSKVSAQAVKKMNPSLNITSWTARVGADTENSYNDAFWERLSGVCNALDNIKARLFVDEKCVFYRKSLLESGTQGTKGNTQVVVPGITESYGSSVDPPTPETPVCLLHSFPNNIEHCLQWARELVFEGSFVKEPEITNNYIEKPDFISTLSQNIKLSTLETLERTLVNRLNTFDNCIKWAREQFEEYYVNRIKSLLHNFPLDYVDQHGTPFWSGSKRPPTPLKYDPNDPLHLDFVVSGAFLKAYTLGIIPSEFKPESFDEQVKRIKRYSSEIQVAEFVPKKIKITTDETVTKEEPTEYTDEDENKTKIIFSNLPPPEKAQQFKMNPIHFEKDNDNNFHIDFIHASANLRALVYGIRTVSRLDSKLIAGKIVPAIVTTTAAVVGFVNLELYKLCWGDKNLADYRNTFLNLGISFFGQTEPLKPSVKKYANKEFTLWDRIDIKKGDLTLRELLNYFKDEHQIEVDMLGVGTALVYASCMAARAKERMPKPMSEVVKEVTRKPLPPRDYFMLEPTAKDLEGNDIDDLPRVCFWYK